MYTYMHTHKLTCIYTCAHYTHIHMQKRMERRKERRGGRLEIRQKLLGARKRSNVHELESLMRKLQKQNKVDVKL